MCWLGGASTLALAQTETPPPKARHHVAVFAGVWIEEVDALEQVGRSQTELRVPTFGLSYEYRTSDNFAPGFFLQHAGGEVNATVLGGGLNIHSAKGIWFLFGSLVERRGDEHTGKLRAGLNWEFLAGKSKRTSITPSLTIDMADQDIVILAGLSFGRLF